MSNSFFRIEHSRRLDITLIDSGFDTMLEIVRLARERLDESPAIQLRGCGGLERQAGMVNPRLNNVRETIDELAVAVGLPDRITIIPLIK